MKHCGTQTISTPRLTLRRFAQSDLEDMLNNWAGDTAVQSEYGEPAYPTAEEAQELLDKYSNEALTQRLVGFYNKLGAVAL